MKRLAVGTVGAVLAMAATAQAGPEPGPGWKPAPDRAEALSAKLRALDHFGGVPVTIASEAFEADQIALFVTTIKGEVADVSMAAVAPIEEIKPPVGPMIEVLGISENAIPAANTFVAEASWRDRSTDVTVTRRVALASDGRMLIATTAECVWTGTTSAALIAMCRNKLAQIESELQIAQRIPVSPGGKAPDLAPSVEPSPDSRLATIRDGGQAVFPPITVAPEPAADRRPLYVGAGLVVLAAAVWWNRRQRERFEPEPDEDADALHTAARGDRAKDDP